MSKFCVAPGVSSKVAEFNQKMSDPVNEKLAEYGYDLPKGETKDELGDIKVVAK